MKKIYIVCSFDDFGGIEKVSLNLASSLELLYSVQIVSDFSYEYDISDVSICQFSEVEDNAVYIVSKKTDLLRLLKSNPLRLFRCLWWRHIPTRRSGQRLHKAFLDEFLDLFMSLFGVGVVYITPALKTLTWQLFPFEHRHVIFNQLETVSTDREPMTRSISPQKKINCLYVYREDIQKRLDIIIEVADRLQDIIEVDVRAPVGFGLDVPLPSNVNLKPFVTNLPETMLEYDLLLLASEFEGFPTVMMEGLSHGLPYLANDCQTGPKDINDTIGGGLIIEELRVEDYVNTLKNIYSSGLDSMILDWEPFNKSNINQQWGLLLGKGKAPCIFNIAES